MASDWKLGQYVRVWKNEGYEYGHVESIAYECIAPTPTDEVMLVGDDGREIYCRVKDLEPGE